MNSAINQAHARHLRRVYAEKILKKGLYVPGSRRTVSWARKGYAKPRGKMIHDAIAKAISDPKYAEELRGAAIKASSSGLKDTEAMKDLVRHFADGPEAMKFLQGEGQPQHWTGTSTALTTTTIFSPETTTTGTTTTASHLCPNK